MPRWRRRSARIGTLVALVFAVAFGCSSGPAEHWRQVEGNAFTVAGHSVVVTALLAGQASQPWLAVGWQADSHGVQSPLGWSSPDGSQWSRDGIRAASFDGPLDRLFGLARRPGVAITAGVTQSPMEGNLRPSMWHRDADGSWHEVAAPRELFGGPRGGGLSVVATTAAGFIVAGGWTGLDDLLDIGVWTSAGSTSWTHVDGEPALSPRHGESIRAISASAAGGAAGVVLAGEADLGAARQGAVWWSADGRHWVRNDVAGSASLQQVVAAPGGFVALGLRADGTAGSWRSADGRSWRAAGRLPAARGVTLTSAAADGPSVIAAGVAGGHVRLWRSSDGESWRAVRLPDGLVGLSAATSVVTAASSGTVLVAVDTVDRGDPSRRAVLWQLS